MSPPHWVILSPVIPGSSLVCCVWIMLSAFLNQEVSEWIKLPSYLSSKTKINAVNVINDCAERGVKLSADFACAAKSEDHLQNVLQVVETDRKKRPNLRKRKLTEQC